jgi:hypothetical protein
VECGRHGFGGCLSSQIRWRCAVVILRCPVPLIRWRFVVVKLVAYAAMDCGVPCRRFSASSPHTNTWTCTTPDKHIHTETKRSHLKHASRSTSAPAFPQACTGATRAPTHSDLHHASVHTQNPKHANQNTPQTQHASSTTHPQILQKNNQQFQIKQDNCLAAQKQ